MQVITAFFRLIRWPNLVFIVLTQFLFYFFVLPTGKAAFNPALFYSLTAASVCIAAGGYIINDYFDVNIDRINKPRRVIVSEIISGKTAVLWFALLSVLGLILSVFIGWQLKNAGIPVANLVVILLLYFYASTFKKKLLIGNIIISLLTAWVIIVLGLAASGSHFTLLPVEKTWQWVLIYAGFAFIISLVREVVKDMEDVKGDAGFDCTTMPLVWGIPAAKKFTIFWILLLVILLFILLLKIKITVVTVYSLIFIVLPLVWIIRSLRLATNATAYHKISSLLKLVMLAGILSMFFYSLY